MVLSLESLEPSSPLVIFGLLPHEQKVRIRIHCLEDVEFNVQFLIVHVYGLLPQLSVVHFVVKRHPTFKDPVQSKVSPLFYAVLYKDTGNV